MVTELLLPLFLAAAALAQDPAPTPAAVQRLLVLNKGEASASLVDPGTRREVALARVGTGPHEVAVAPDGRTAVVCNYGDRMPGSTLSLIDVATGTTTKTFPLLVAGDQDEKGDGGAQDEPARRYLRPHGVCFLPDGRHVVVTSESARRLLLVDVAAGAVVRALPTAQSTLHMVALAPDGRTAYGTSIRDGTLAVFDLADESAPSARIVPTGAGAEGLAVSAATGEVWVGNREADTLSVYDPAAGEVTATLDTAQFPIRVAMTPDGGHALVSCADDGVLQVFDVRARRLAHTVELAGDESEVSPLPIGICVEPDGRHAWVACTRGEFLAVVDLRTFRMVDRVAARHGPDGMAFAVLRDDADK